MVKSEVTPRLIEGTKHTNMLELGLEPELVGKGLAYRLVMSSHAQKDTEDSRRPTGPNDQALSKRLCSQKRSEGIFPVLFIYYLTPQPFKGD